MIRYPGIKAYMNGMEDIASGRDVGAGKIREEVVDSVSSTYMLPAMGT